jgi:hypothetical protein
MLLVSENASTQYVSSWLFLMGSFKHGLLVYARGDRLRSHRYMFANYTQHWTVDGLCMAVSQEMLRGMMAL